MGKAIVLSESNGDYRHWADQFVAADPSNRDTVLVNPRRIHRNPSVVQRMRYVNRYYGEAASRAGRNGVIIVSLGHGAVNDTDTAIGWVDLLPNQAFRVHTRHLRYSGSDMEQGDLSVLSREPNRRTCRGILESYDLDSNTRRPEPRVEHLINYMSCSGARAARPRQQFQAAYARIGELLRTNNVREVVLLTCMVGNARRFVNLMANSWRVNILAYKRRVAANRDNARENPYYIYLIGTEDRLYRQELPNRSGHRERPG